jgi:hypothetical protein
VAGLTREIQIRLAALLGVINAVRLTLRLQANLRPHTDGSG